MHVNVLGRLEVGVGSDDPTPIRGRRNQELMGLLTLHAGSAVPDAEMFDALWPGDLPGDPRCTLRTYVSRLRRHLPSGSVERTPDGYRLVVDPSDVDAWRFEAMAEQGIERLREAPSVERLRELDEALDTWQGDAWMELTHVPRADAERRRLEELHDQAEEAAVAGLLTLDDPERAVRRALTLIDASPLRETRWELLARAHHAMRNPAAALRSCREGRRTFVEQLGIGPSERLADLEMAILRGDPLPAIQPAPPGTRHRPTRIRTEVVDAPMGRSAEVDDLERAITQALSGGPPLIALTGEAGIGKTTLLQHLRATRPSDRRFVVATCHEPEAAGALRPIVALLDQIDPSDEERGRPVHQRLGVEPGDGVRQRLGLFDALGDRLREVAGGPGLVVIIDDVQWADPASLEALGHVVRHRKGAPIALLIAYRDTEVRAADELGSLITDADRCGGAVELALGGIDLHTVGWVLERSRGSVDSVTIERVLELTGGNPFLVAELARTAHPGDPNELPDSVHRLVAHLARDLPGEAADLLQHLALCAGPVPLELLQPTGSGVVDDVVSSLEEVVDRGLVVEVSNGSAIEYGFAHDIYRHAIAGQLIAARSVGVHRRLARSAERLRSRFGARWAPAAAYHWFAAGRLGDPERCVQSCLEAADMATAETAYDDALTHVTRAVEARGWIDSGVGDGGVLRLRLAEAAHRAGRVDERRLAASLAVGEAIRDGSPEITAAGALLYAGTRSAFGSDDADAVELLERAWDALRGAGESDREALVASRLAQEIHQRGDRPGGRALARDAVALLDADSIPATRMQVLMGLVWTLNDPEHFDERVERIDEMLAESVESGDPELEIMAREWRAAMLLEVGDAVALDAEIEQLEALARRSPVPGKLGQIATLRTTRALMSGDIERGVELAGETYQFNLAHEPGMAETVFRAQMLAPLREQGLLDSIVPLVRDMVADFPGVPAWRCGLAFILSETGQCAEAAEIVGDVLADGVDALPLDVTWGQAIASLAEAVANCELAQWAEALETVLAPHSGRSLPLWFIVAGASVDHLRGRLALVTGDFDHAELLLSSGRDFHRRAGMAPMEARSTAELTHVATRRAAAHRA